MRPCLQGMIIICFQCNYHHHGCPHHHQWSASSATTEIEPYACGKPSVLPARHQGERGRFPLSLRPSRAACHGGPPPRDRFVGAPGLGERALAFHRSETTDRRPCLPSSALWRAFLLIFTRSGRARSLTTLLEHPINVGLSISLCALPLRQLGGVQWS